MRNKSTKKIEHFSENNISCDILGFDDSKKKSLFLKIVLYICFFPTSILMIGVMRERRKENKHLKEKLRYFNPIIKEGFWSNSITWVGREKPLSDDELNNFCDYN